MIIHTLHNLLKLARVLQIRQDESLLWYLYLFLCLLREVNHLCAQIHLPAALECDKSAPHLSEQGEPSRTSFANARTSFVLLKNSRVAASFNGRLSYAVSSQLAISFLSVYTIA